MTLWKVHGELTTDSGSGGEETWFYLTRDRMTLPDVHKTLYAHGSKNGRDWHRIDSVTAIGELNEWHEECPPEFLKQVVTQR